MNQSIYVVDDSEMMRVFIGRLCEKFGTVTQFTSGEAVITALSSGVIPNIIILDLNLPGIHGIEILKILQTNYSQFSIQTYVVSGVDNSQEKINCLSLGAKDFIVKPFHPKELEYKIQSFSSNP